MHSGNIEIVKLLIERGATITPHEDATAFIEIARESDEHELADLITKKLAEQQNHYNKRS
jgi:hypothetical protein